ncbi:MAG: hypothetical protein BAJALOKI3v1_60050 [Promethearchaeota archaeon]|nr:MAG: hypothetical protein BAJALOKI3v1_60050 [Candidatus Lokiarchaeota archaeon]
MIEEDHQVNIRDPKEFINLRKIPIEKVDLVINTLNDTTQSILITKPILDLNKDCKIITRMFLDEVADVLMNKPFNTRMINSSKLKLEIMKREIIKCVVLIEIHY